MTSAFLTGGSGYLGRGILRQIQNGSLPWSATVYSRSEQKQNECALRYPEMRYILGDVRDLEHLKAAMVGHDIVIHMAAMKRIPEAECNAQECVSVNIGGSESVIAAARAARVQRVVGISTDKAVQPVNVYGATKMAMERMFAEASSGGTVFTCTRYGNVIGSTGSVIPLFKRQARESGCVTLTNPKMTRFWMSVDEAVDIILNALQAAPGTIIVPLARAMTMADVATAAVGEVKVEVVGERPGEKLHESLIHYQESVRIIRQISHLELLPTGKTPAEISKPFTLSSQNPHFWMNPEEMRNHIEDAKEV